MLHLNKVQKEDNLHSAFSYFDIDGSGYITLDELQEVCTKLGIETSHLDEVIREADQNNVIDLCFLRIFFFFSLIYL